MMARPMKLREGVFFALACSSACLLSSCFSGNPPIHQMNTLLDQGIATHQVKDLGTWSIPDEVSSALLPELSSAPHASPVVQQFDLQVSQMPARDFFMGLVKDTPYNMVISPQVQGDISLNLKHVSIEQVLNAVHDIYGYRYVYTPYGFEIFPSGLQTKIFTVDYLDIRRSGRSFTGVTSGELTQTANQAGSSGAASTSGTSGSGSKPASSSDTQSTTLSSQVNTESQADFWKTLKSSLEALLGDSLKTGSQVVLNPAAGVVVVRATPEQLIEVAKYLDQTQLSMNREVLIDTQILEVTLNDKFQGGVDWQVLGLRISGMGFANENEGISGESASSGTMATPLDPFTQIFSGRIRTGNFAAVIHALNEQGNVQTLSSPRLSTMNNQEAVIKVGQDQYFTTGFSGDTLSNSSGATTGTTQSVTLAPFFSGIALSVIPQISANGEVTLHIHPLVSDVTKDNQTFAINSSSSSSSFLRSHLLGTDTPSATDAVDLALSKVRESDSIIRAQSGQVVILGGLMTNEVKESVAGVPLLDRLPFIGALFRRTYQSSVKSELVILMRPVVVDEHTFENELESTKEDYETMNRGFHVGSHPDRFGTLAETDYFQRINHTQELKAGKSLLSPSPVVASTGNDRIFATHLSNSKGARS